jgi:hypothetical protein
MKKTASIIVVLINMLIFISCDRVTTETIRSFVVDYADYDSIHLKLSKADNISLNWYHQISIIASWSKGREKEIYDSICEKRNDMNYNKRIQYIYIPEEGHYYIGNITKIDITSDTDFDSTHPAGSKLNDVVRIISFSPYKFIESGYKETYNWGINRPLSFNKEPDLEGVLNILAGSKNDVTHFPVDKLLSEITPTDLILIGNGYGSDFIGYLLFDSTPSVNKAQHLTVTVKTAEGKVFTKSISKTFK